MAYKWTKCVDGLPKKEGTYLCASKAFSGNRFYCTYCFAKDLYKVSQYDFSDKKKVSGFYGSDPEYGYYEADYVEAWMPIPEYKGD